MMIKRLPWDSTFFDLEIGKIESDSVEKAKEFITSLSFTNDLNLLYVFIKGDTSTHIELELGSLIDVKYVYSINLSHTDSFAIDSQLKLIKSPSSKLYDLALQSGHESRFKKDPNFKKGIFERFYKTWIDNSFKGIMANYVFGYYDHNELLGFITLKIKDHQGEIGLFAVDVAARGKGIGMKLIETAKAFSSLEGCTTLNVATQKDNKGACKFYAKAGFQLKEIESIYHKWL